MRIFTLKLKQTFLLLSLFIAFGQLIYAQAPVINSFSPTSACSGSGINDTIVGTNLFNALDVSFNGTPASIIYNTNDTIIAVLPNGATTGLISVTTYNGVGYSSTNFTVNPLPTPMIMGATNACTGDSINLTVGNYAAYNWSTSSTADNIYAFTSGNYSVTVTDTNGCMGSASTTLSFGTSLSPVITGNTSFCVGDSSLLSVGMYNHYIWNNSDTTSSVWAKTSGTFSVTVTNHTGCTGTASLTVTAHTNPTPSITHSGSTTFCQGGSVTLSAGTFASYMWSDGSTTSSISATTAGTYTVTVTNVYGCTGTASQAVVVNPLPTPTITPSGATTFCFGGTVSLNAGAGYTSYHWNNGATTQSVTATVSYDYIVTVTNSNGCAGTATQSVTVNPNPVTIVTANGPTTFCAGGSVMLDAGSFSAYHWSNGANTETVSITTSGTYTVTVTNSFGCTGTASSAAITVHALPVVSIPGATSICTGDSSLVLHSLVTFASYMWSTGATTDTIHVYDSGTYTLTVTDANGCTNTASKTVIVDSILHPTISGMTAICQGTHNVLDAGTYLTYHWNSGNSTAQTITRDTAGTYVVTVNNGALCHGTDSITVVVNPLPTPSITSNGPDTFCAGGSVTLDAGTFTAYHWNMNNDTLETNVAMTTGNYIVTVTDANGCTKTASQSVDVVPIPPAFTIYYLTNELFSSALTNNQWYRNDVLIPGATGQTYTPSQLGVYYDIVTINGCSTQSSDSITVTQLGVGINEVSNDNHFSLFPNPTNGNLNLSYHLTINTAVEFRITDVIGRTVYTSLLKGTLGTETMDISDLSKGIYYWEAVSNNTVLEKGKIAVIK